jgi:uncharacterized membrane protein YbhN (UPF0104 family)
MLNEHSAHDTEPAQTASDMSRPAWRTVTWIVVVAVLFFAWRAGARFPWSETRAAMLNADPSMLIWAAIISLLALGAKGWAWHLLLRPLAPHRWWIAQEANLVGSAVNYVSVAVIGEAARVRLLANRDRVPLDVAIASVVWTRAMEGVGLALFILAGGLLLTLPPMVRRAEIGAAVVVTILIVGIRLRGAGRIPDWFPASLRRTGHALREIGSWKRFPAPLLLALANWLGQWATYHLTLAATGIPVSPSASFTATLASNIGGALRLTPANVGITQASIALALLPFGINPAAAIAASLILQVLQVVPVLALAVGVVGWKGLAQLQERAALEG